MKRQGWSIKKYRLGDESTEFWKNIPGDKKVEYAWDMVVEAMKIKGTSEKLRFQKILSIKSLANFTKRSQ